jgi:hypothetical protein
LEVTRSAWGPDSVEGIAPQTQGTQTVTCSAGRLGFGSKINGTHIFEYSPYL